MSEKKSKLEEILKEGLKSAKDAISTAKKAANIGSKKVSIYMLKTKLRDRFAELGAVTYRLLVEDKKENIGLTNKLIQSVIENIESIRQEINAAEEKLQNIREQTK